MVRVEIQRIDPPPDVVDSMHNQMRAERHRRATVTEALGVREAAITRAEGEKQSAILEAQGGAEAIERLAEADRIRQIRVADGEAAAIRNVFAAIHEGGPTADVIALKYLEALRSVANGQRDQDLPPDRDGRAVRHDRRPGRDACHRSRLGAPHARPAATPTVLTDPGNR